MAVPAASAFMTTSTNGPITSQLNAANTGVNMYVGTQMGWKVESNQAKEEDRSIPFILWLTFVLFVSFATIVIS